MVFSRAHLSLIKYEIYISDKGSPLSFYFSILFYAKITSCFVANSLQARCKLWSHFFLDAITDIYTISLR